MNFLYLCVMIKNIVLNADEHRCCHCIKADHFCWLHLCFPRGGMLEQEY